MLDVLDALLGCGGALVRRVLLPLLPEVLTALHAAIAEAWAQQPAKGGARVSACICLLRDRVQSFQSLALLRSGGVSRRSQAALAACRCSTQPRCLPCTQQARVAHHCSPSHQPLRGRTLRTCDPVPQGRRRAVGSAGHRELAILEQLGGLAGDAQLAGRLADALVALLTQAGGQWRMGRRNGYSAEHVLGVAVRTAHFAWSTAGDDASGRALGSEGLWAGGS